MDKQVISQLSDFMDHASRGFEYTQAGETKTGMIIHKDGEYFAYKNQCPHTGAPLDWIEHQFLDMDNEFIQCSVHDARFNIETGLCVVGPCVNESLQPLKITIQNQTIYLAEEFS